MTDNQQYTKAAVTMIHLLHNIVYTTLPGQVSELGPLRE